MFKCLPAPWKELRWVSLISSSMGVSCYEKCWILQPPSQALISSRQLKELTFSWGFSINSLSLNSVWVLSCPTTSKRHTLKYISFLCSGVLGLSVLAAWEKHHIFFSWRRHLNIPSLEKLIYLSLFPSQRGGEERELESIFSIQNKWLSDSTISIKAVRVKEWCLFGDLFENWFLEPAWIQK